MMPIDISTLLENTAVELLRRAATALPQDVKERLREAYRVEERPAAKMCLRAILDNLELAERRALPLCQDTGLVWFYVRNPMGDCSSALRRAVQRATREVPLRPNAVHPLERTNTKDNTGAHIPHITYDFDPRENFITLVAFPKGAGSENMSKLAMLSPAEGLRGVKKFVLGSVVSAGGKPCPPLVLGIGLGGGADISMKLAKKALLRDLSQRNADPQIAELERELKNALNATGIGPMGLGGGCTVLAVNIEWAHCHTASLPVAVNIQCWAARKAAARIFADGGVEYV